jgi:O-antigen/teichoic acid export membrane protein
VSEARTSARLTRGALSSVGVDLALAAAALVAAPIMVRTLGPPAYGIYVLVTVLAGQLGFLQLGLAPAVTRRVAEARGAGDAGSVRATVHVAWLLAAASALLLAIAFWLGGPAFFARVGGIAGSTLFAAAAAVAAQPIVGVSQAVLLGRERFTALATVRLIQGLARTVAGVAVVIAGGGVAAVLVAQAVLDLTGILAALLVDGEKLAIGWARSLDQLTYYAVPYGAVFRMAIVPAALATVLAPRLSALSAAGRVDDAALLVRRTTRVTAAILIAAAAPLAACAPEWLGLWLGADFAHRADATARLLLVAVVVNGIASPACTVVRAGGRPSALVIAYAAELPLHVVAVYALVRGWGIVGAAGAWLLRAALDAVLQRWLASRVVGRSFGDGPALTAGVASLLALVLACALIGPGWWGVRLLAGLALSLAALLRGLDRDDWSVLRLAAGGASRGAVAA